MELAVRVEKLGGLGGGFTFGFLRWRKFLRRLGWHNFLRKGHRAKICPIAAFALPAVCVTIFCCTGSSVFAWVEAIFCLKAHCADSPRSPSSCRRMARRNVSSIHALTSACVRSGGGVLRDRDGGGEFFDGAVFVEVMEQLVNVVLQNFVDGCAGQSFEFGD